MHLTTLYMYKNIICLYLHVLPPNWRKNVSCAFGKQHIPSINPQVCDLWLTIQIQQYLVKDARFSVIAYIRMMSRNYKFRDQAKPYFISFATVYWIEGKALLRRSYWLHSHQLQTGGRGGVKHNVGIYVPGIYVQYEKENSLDFFSHIGQLFTIAGTSNAVKSQLFYQASKTGQALESLKYVKTVRNIGIAGTSYGMAISVRNMANDFHEGGIKNVKFSDMTDFCIGTGNLILTVGRVTTPLGLVYTGASTIYFVSRTIYDISNEN